MSSSFGIFVATQLVGEPYHAIAERYGLNINIIG
jgi:hypothetical protein